MDRLQEAINTFDRWVSGQRASVAMSRYAELAGTQSGQKKILKDASNGDTVAADFLFLQLKKIIAKAFWKYFMGPKTTTHPLKISQGADEDFASIAYSMLMGQGDPSPYKTFNPAKFTKTADLIKQFGYYVYRYLQNEAVKIHREDKLGGMTGNLKQGTADVKLSSYEDIAAPKESGFAGAEPAVSNSFTSDIDERETIRVFLEHLKGLRPIYHDVFYWKLKGLSTEDVAKKLAVSGQSVRNHLKDIQRLYKEFIGE